VSEIRADLAGLMEGMTIFHDVMCQTGGTMQVDGTALDEKFDHPEKLLGYLDGAGDEPDAGEG